MSSSSSRTTAMSAVSRLRGSQLKNHVDSIIGRYNQHHWSLLSKKDDPSQTPNHISLPKVSITTLLLPLLPLLPLL
jgi:hypothetical protein